MESTREGNRTLDRRPGPITMRRCGRRIMGLRHEYMSKNVVAVVSPVGPY